jgi:uncharacterized membrane protein YdfJ with MMPL/SSD domain
MGRSTTHKPRLARLGEFTYRQRRLVLLAWIVGLLAVFAASSQLGGQWSADYETPGSESKAASDRLEERFPGRQPYARRRKSSTRARISCPPPARPARPHSALERGLEPRQATVEAVATAGRSVLIAATTVVISLLGLFLMGLTYLYGVALSAIVAVLVVMAASVTLLPARLGFARQRVNRLRIPGIGKRRPGESSDRAGALGPCDPAPAVGRPRSPGRRSCWCWRRRSPGCGSASRTPATTAPRRPPAGRTT